MRVVWTQPDGPISAACCSLRCIEQASVAKFGTQIMAHSTSVRISISRNSMIFVEQVLSLAILGQVNHGDVGRLSVALGNCLCSLRECRAHITRGTECRFAGRVKERICIHWKS